MSFFSDENTRLAEEIIKRYPKARSAMIPLLHLAQEQEGWVTEAAMAEIAELVGTSSAEVLGTCSFYEMFKREPVGKYLINICTTMSCALMGAADLMQHAEKALGVKSGGTTEDGMFTLEGAECQAACTEAPCLQVNYRHRYRVTADEFDAMLAELSTPDPAVPEHGVLSQIRQHIPEKNTVGALPPEEVNAPPVWLNTEEDQS